MTNAGLPSWTRLLKRSRACLHRALRRYLREALAARPLHVPSKGQKFKLRSRCKQHQTRPAPHKKPPMRCDRRCLPENTQCQVNSTRNAPRTKVGEVFLDGALASICGRRNASARTIQRPARRAMLRKVLGTRVRARESHVATHLHFFLWTCTHKHAKQCANKDNASLRRKGSQIQNLRARAIVMRRSLAETPAAWQKRPT